jgi:hypothetical protein
MAFVLGATCDTLRLYTLVFSKFGPNAQKKSAGENVSRAPCPLPRPPAYTTDSHFLIDNLRHLSFPERSILVGNSYPDFMHDTFAPHDRDSGSFELPGGYCCTFHTAEPDAPKIEILHGSSSILLPFFNLKTKFAEILLKRTKLI